VALLNDCKYGHALRGSTLDLNLLRSTSSPDPAADQGAHEFTYALLPHAGDLAAGQVIQRAYELNAPLRAAPAAPRNGPAPARASFLQVDAPNVIVEAVKQAEDGADLIARLYESTGASTRAKIRLGFGAASAALVDLMEEHPQPLALEDGCVELRFAPFEIHTLRLAR
jgi:alpha-mannosidase